MLYMKMVRKTALALSVAIFFTFSLVGCAEGKADQIASAGEEKSPSSVSGAVNFKHELDSYTPGKDSYNFYFTYKRIRSIII